MSRSSPQIWIRIAVVIAMVVGLLRPPFGSEDHDHHDAALTLAMDEVGHRSASAVDDRLKHAASDHVSVSDADHGDRHDSGDHSHVASNVPPKMTVPRFSPCWETPLACAATLRSTTEPSFERPPRSASLA